MIKYALRIYIKCYKTLVKRQITGKGGKEMTATGREKMTLLLGIEEGQVQEETGSGNEETIG